jgi:hypothetical protein
MEDKNIQTLVFMYEFACAHTVYNLKQFIISILMQFCRPWYMTLSRFKHKVSQQWCHCLNSWFSIGNKTADSTIWNALKHNWLLNRIFTVKSDWWRLNKWLEVRTNIDESCYGDSMIPGMYLRFSLISTVNFYYIINKLIILVSSLH